MGSKRVSVQKQKQAKGNPNDFTQGPPHWRPSPLCSTPLFAQFSVLPAKTAILLMPVLICSGRRDPLGALHREDPRVGPAPHPRLMEPRASVLPLPVAKLVIRQAWAQLLPRILPTLCSSTLGRERSQVPGQVPSCMSWEPGNRVCPNSPQHAVLIESLEARRSRPFQAPSLVGQ